jgi:protein SCO1/2
MIDVPASYRTPLTFARVVVTLVVGAVLASCGGSVDPGSGPTTPSTEAAESPTPYSLTGLWGIDVRPAVPIEPVRLTDQYGRAFRFPRPQGAAPVTLLYFGYTYCPDICPSTMAEIAVALREVPTKVAQHVDVVFVTVDPARDDPQRLRQWIGLFSEEFTALTGPIERIEAMQRQLGYEPGPVSDLGGGAYVVGHPAEYLAVAPDGTVRLVYPWGVTVPQLEEDLTRLVEEGWPE